LQSERLTDSKLEPNQAIQQERRSKSYSTFEPWRLSRFLGRSSLRGQRPSSEKRPFVRQKYASGRRKQLFSRHSSLWTYPLAVVRPESGRCGHDSRDGIRAFPSTGNRRSGLEIVLETRIE
jgi:hypothetical protein